MTVFGVDIGIRSFHAVKIVDNHVDLYSAVVKKGTRWEEIQELSTEIMSLPGVADFFFIEEPPLAGMRNIRTALQLAQTAGALLASISSPSYLVPVSQWKKEVVGKGNAAKEEVAEFVELHSPNVFNQCGKNQNFIDAYCIAIYGVKVMASL